MTDLNNKDWYEANDWKQEKIEQRKLEKTWKWSKTCDNNTQFTKNVKLYKTRKENQKYNIIIRGKQTKSRKNLQEQYGVDITAIKINN